VIAATHGNLEELIVAGRFRGDLYYRLRVVEIRVPPLRERRGDIPRLAEHFVVRAARELHRPPPLLTGEAMKVLVAHDWPGNVRELENTLTRATVLATGGVLRPDHLALGVSARTAAPGELASLEDIERHHVARVLAATQGHKTRAAELLGISRPRLNRLIQKFGLE
jgi:two-component system response regulator AtoC